MTDSDAVALAQEFRAANDEDILTVMGVQSSKKLNDLNRLFFYVVPSTWMRKAWPLLSGTAATAATYDVRQVIEQIGRIEVASLLVQDHQVSDEEDEDRQKHNKSLVLHELQKRQTEVETRPGAADTADGSSSSLPLHHRRPEILRPELKHGEHFVVMGPSAWRMVKYKFGYDHEVKRKCTFVDSDDGTSLAVVLHEGKDSAHPEANQPIPPAGYFPYDELLLVGTANAAAHPGNVSDDETDVFPMLGQVDADVSDHAPLTNDPVLLLPASTTTTTPWQPPTDHDESSSHQIVESRAVLRRYGSGLGNLGNTCFMNSTLQCLAHTDPLRKYFLSGAYENDLNADNPLGTGGDLASQFAQLMAEMWWTTTTTPENGGTSSSYQRSSMFSNEHSSTNVVYPRNFKYTLGKHAEQFMGYDQHDSQELATYLLDALHEDTNRVTQKPYIEKPEQAENESDEQAADKAWDLHKKREDSYVMENFMAQVKSRVQCCEENCGRISTTFDPIMFLSVPIPGSSERTLPVTFVPLNPKERPKSFSVTISKMASLRDLLQKVQERVINDDLTGEGRSVELEDLAMCDVWQNDIHAWHTLSRDVSIIRDTDETIIYELSPLAQIRAIEEKAEARNRVDEGMLGLRSLAPRPRRYQLDVAEMTRLNTGDQWVEELKQYIHSIYSYSTAFDPHRGTTEERVSYYNKLVAFIDLCYKEVENENETPGQKRGREDSEVDAESNSSTVTVSPSDPAVRGIEDRCDSQRGFENVKSVYHVTVLAFIAKKLRVQITRMEKYRKGHTPNGVKVEIRMRKSGGHSSIRDQQRLTAPLVLRIPSTMNVYGLREELARRLERCLTSETPAQPWTNGERREESEVLSATPTAGSNDTSFGSPALLVMRQIPLSFQSKGAANHSFSGGKQLGSLARRDGYAYDGTKPISLASLTDDDEKEHVAELVGEHGSIYVDWPSELTERHFDKSEYESVDDLDADAKLKKDGGVMTVQDCIDKFCQMEQLEETEMWYCNRCKQHVRAWKQFHIYRSPPILLVHLKRFHYSARSHRRDKISTFVDFPLKNLDLSDQVLNWTEDKKPIYDCYAVSNHYGGLGGGHYTAYALNDDGEWCYYEDSRITTAVDPKEVVSDAAYVLYYRRRDVPVGEDFVMNLQTPGSPAPALIQVERGRDPDASEVSSSAAMVGDDMDIEDTDDVASRVTSPMGSIDGDLLAIDGETGSDIDHLSDDRDPLPLQ